MANHSVSVPSGRTAIYGGLPAPAGTPGTWATRSAAAGVTLATRFDTDAEVNAWKAGTLAEAVAREINFGASGGACLRFDILATHDESGGNWCRWLKPDFSGFSEGDTFFLSYRLFVPDYLATHVFSGGGGWKTSILSRRASTMNGISQSAPVGSNQVNEIVLQNTGHRGMLQGYNQDGAAFPPWDVSRVTGASASDIIRQNAVDRGGPDTTQDEAWAKHGGCLSYEQAGRPYGRPNPRGGEFIYRPSEWISIKLRVQIGNWNTANSRVQLWAARDGAEAWDLLTDRADIQLGAGPDMDALWLTPFNTGRQPDTTRADTYVCYDEVIVSTQDIALPVAAEAPSVPSWAPQTLYSWATISTNTLSDIDPADIPALNPNHPAKAPWEPCASNLGQAGIFDAWNGGAFAADRGAMGSLLLWGGGHNAYFGNEIYEFDVARRAWTRATNPFAGDPGTIGTPGSHPLGEFSDGSAVPQHTYNGLEYMPGVGLFSSSMANGLCAANTHSMAYSHIYSFHGNDTMPGQKWLRTRASSNTGGPTSAIAYDPTRGVIWRASEAQPLDRYDPAGTPAGGEYGTWTRFGSNWTVGQDSAAAYYPVDDLFVHLNFISGNNIRLIQCANPGAGHTVANESGTAPIGSVGSSFNWIPELGKFAVHNGASGSLYLLTPPAAGDGLTGTWTWEQIATTGTPPTAAATAVYSRMRYCPALKSLIVCNDTNAPVYALRVVP